MLPGGVAVRAVGLTKRFRLLRLWRPSAADDIDDDEVDGDDLAGDDADATRVGTNPLALDDVNLTVARGSMVGIVGPEAAGKTTLIRLIAGTLRPTAGQVLLRGRVAPPPATMAKLLEPAYTPARNLNLVAAMLGSPPALTESAADRVFAAAGLTGMERRPLQSLPADTAATLVMAAFLHLEIDVFLFDPAPKIKSEDTRDRLFALLARRLDEGACALTTARLESRLPDCCNQIVELEDGRVRRSGPVGGVREVVAPTPPPPSKFLGRSDAVAVGEIVVTTDSSGDTCVSVPVEIIDPAAELTFGLMLALDGRAAAKYTEHHGAAPAGPRLVTVEVPGQRQLVGKHRVHFSVAVARGDDRQIVLAQPMQAALQRGLHGPEATAVWSVEAR